MNVTAFQKNLTKLLKNFFCDTISKVSGTNLSLTMNVIAKHKLYSKFFFNTPYIKSELHSIDLDASGQVYGRFVCLVVSEIRKNYKYLTFNAYPDVKIRIFNLTKLYFTGNKTNEKKWFRHSGYMGGLKSEKIDFQSSSNVKKIFFKSLRGMLPKNSCSSKIIGKMVEIC
jgi:large subunit ribosomal protein L13